MSTDYSKLVNLLQGGSSFREISGLEPEQILRSLRRGAASKTDPLELFKSALLTKAAEMQALGSM